MTSGGTLYLVGIEYATPPALFLVGRINWISTRMMARAMRIFLIMGVKVRKRGNGRMLRPAIPHPGAVAQQPRWNGRMAEWAEEAKGLKGKGLEMEY